MPGDVRQQLTRILLGPQTDPAQIKMHVKMNDWHLSQPEACSRREGIVWTPSSVPDTRYSTGLQMIIAEAPGLGWLISFSH
jgi:hypothetical protein